MLQYHPVVRLVHATASCKPLISWFERSKEDVEQIAMMGRVGSSYEGCILAFYSLKFCIRSLKFCSGAPLMLMPDSAGTFHVRVRLNSLRPSSGNMMQNLDDPGRPIDSPSVVSSRFKKRNALFLCLKKSSQGCKVARHFHLPVKPPSMLLRRTTRASSSLSS